MAIFPDETRLRLQNEETMRDLPSRLVSIPLALLLSLHFLSPAVVLGLLVAILLIEWLGVIAARRVRRELTQRNALFLLFLTVCGSIAFSVMPVLLWRTGEITAQIIGFAVLVTGLLHSIMNRTTCLVIGVATAIPLVVALVLSVVGFLFLQEDPVNAAIGGAMMLTMIVYIAMSFRTSHRSRSGLIELTAKAEAASRAKSRFLAVMSHEIRTPLNGILGMAQVLEEEAEDPLARERISLLSKCSFSLKAIVDDVLDNAKIEAGRFDLHAQPVHLANEVRSVVELHRLAAEGKGLTLELSVASELPPNVEVDPLRMRQVLGNLLSNAIKFTGEGSIRIAVAGTRSGPASWTIRIAVTDTGPGLSPAAQTELFEDFAQIPLADDLAPGTGLGLSIARGLARLMGGDVRVTSSPGKGATFTFSFTAVASHEAAMPPLPTAEQRIAGRVLLVDDVASNRYVVRSLLRKQAIEVVEARDGVEAMELLEDSGFDAVLLDMHMPRMNGAATIAAMRKAGGRIGATPVIVMTADAMDENRERAMSLNVAGYIPKPVDRFVLTDALQRAMKPGTRAA